MENCFTRQNESAEGGRSFLRGRYKCKEINLEVHIDGKDFLGCAHKKKEGTY